MKLNDYLPKTKPEKQKLIQGYVDENLRRRTRAKMKDMGINWDQLMTAACKAFLEEPK